MASTSRRGTGVRCATNRDDVPVATSGLSDTRRALLTALLSVPLSLLRSAALTTGIVLTLWSVTAGGDVGSDVSAASRLAVVVWLASFGVHVTALGGTWSILPLGLVAVSIWSCHRAARRGIRDLGYPGRQPVLVFLGAFCVGHIAVITGIAWWVSHEGVRISPAQAALASAIAVAAVSGYVTLRDARTAVVDISLSPTVTAAFSITRRTLFTLIAISSIALLTSTIVHWREATALTQEFGAGGAVTVGMWVVSLWLAPNVAIWGAGFLFGAPVAVHATQTISVFAGSATKLPPLPILAAFPQQPPPWAWAVLLVPVAVSAGFAFMASTEFIQSPGQLVGLVAGCAVVFGTLTMAVAYLASGGFGYPGWPRLGLDWRAAVYGAGLCALGTALGSWWASRNTAVVRT